MLDVICGLVALIPIAMLAGFVWGEHSERAFSDLQVVEERRSADFWRSRFFDLLKADDEKIKQVKQKPSRRKP